MQYRYAIDGNFEDFASGRVLYARPGSTAFPVRLASEIYQRCRSHWQNLGGEGRCTIYDPTCGGAYWLVVLAYLHWDGISAIYASDVDDDAVELAKRNLSLLTFQGLEQRTAEIQMMLADYGKASHVEALGSARWFLQNLDKYRKSHAIASHVFRADAADVDMIRVGIGGTHIDILLADVPYGWHTSWRGVELGDAHSPIWFMLAALLPILSPRSIIAIATDKRQKTKHDAYHRLERFQVGKRRVEILHLAKNTCEV